MSELNGRRRFQINTGPLEVVPAARRAAWQELAREVEVDVPTRFRRKWSQLDTARVILAEPHETYEDVGKEIDRSPGAVRYRRQAMIHLIRDEHGARERVEDYRGDEKKFHKHHDYFQVDELLRELGIYDMAVSEQFALAKPLRQPSAGWRGDGLGTVLAKTGIRALQADFRRLMREARAVEGQSPVPDPPASS